MNDMLSADYWQKLFRQTYHWIDLNVFTTSTLGQLIAIASCVLVAVLIGPGLRKTLEQWQPQNSVTSYFQPLAMFVARIGIPINILIFTSLLLLGSVVQEYPHRLILIVSNLLLAWVIIQFATGFVKNEFWRSLIAFTAWTIAALNILGLLHKTIVILGRADITLGTVHLSALGIIKAILTLVVLLWMSVFFSDLVERQLSTSRSFTPSIQVLLSKLVRVIAITAALLLALSSLGIDLTAFAVFSGAIGVGIGFGLQKVFSNLISGIILLLDKSIKPGDVIGINEYYGKVNSLGARYVSVITRDGIEYLIPNEEIISERVENWSYSNQLVRLRLDLGVHYQSDVDKAIALCIEAALEVDRVLKEPKPVCLLSGFGDSSVDFQLRFWISDPMNGRANVKSEIYLKIWHKFHANDIEIPYPQRDLHIRSIDNDKAKFKTE